MSSSADSSVIDIIFQSLVAVFRLIIKIIMGVFQPFSSELAGEKNIDFETCTKENIFALATDFFSQKEEHVKNFQ